MILPPTAEIAFRYIQSTRDYIMETARACHMQVFATPEFLEQNPHLTPYVFTTHVGDDVVILNISPMAIRDFRLENTNIIFKARYQGVEYVHTVSLHGVIGVYDPAMPQIIHTCIPTTILVSETAMHMVHGVAIEVADGAPTAEVRKEEPTRPSFLTVVK